MTTAVIGAAARVGSEIVRGLLARGDPVAALVRDPDKARRAFGEPDGLHIRPTRLDDPRDLTEAFGGIRTVFIAPASSDAEKIAGRIVEYGTGGRVPSRVPRGIRPMHFISMTPRSMHDRPVTSVDLTLGASASRASWRTVRLRRLGLEQAIGGKTVDRRHGAAVSVKAGADDRAVGQVLVQELARFGEDQVGLVQLSALGVEIRERDPGPRVGDARQRLRDGVATRGWSRLLDVR